MQMKYRRRTKLRPFERSFRTRPAAILFAGLGAGDAVLTHNYAFVVGAVIGVLVGVVSAAAEPNG